jgi:Scramblase
MLIFPNIFRNRQFAVVENPGLWNWTFTLKDEEDNVLAQIDRNWRGIGLEVSNYFLSFEVCACFSYVYV